MYFSLESAENVSDHIMALFGAKIQAYTKSKTSLDIELEKEEENGAVFMCTSSPGISQLNGPQYETKY